MPLEGSYEGAVSLRLKSMFFLFRVFKDSLQDTGFSVQVVGSMVYFMGLLPGKVLEPEPDPCGQKCHA